MMRLLSQQQIHRVLSSTLYLELRKEVVAPTMDREAFGRRDKLREDRWQTSSARGIEKCSRKPS